MVFETLTNTKKSKINNNISLTYFRLEKDYDIKKFLRTNKSSTLYMIKI